MRQRIGAVRRVAIDAGSVPIGMRALLFVALHAPLAFLMLRVSVVTSIVALGVVGLGFSWAWSVKRPIEDIALIAAYIAGAEVLWRMTNDVLFWELAKYSITAILGLALLRRHGVASLLKPALGFGLLLPSAVLTLALDPWQLAKNQLSFNLSGPLALVVCVGFFAYTRLSPRQLQKMFIAGIAPVVGLGSNVLYGIISTPDIVVGHGSNFALSGGFGPNQVSALLGLGATFAFLLLIDKNTRWEMRVAMFGISVWLLFQSAMTFSRGGAYCFTGACLSAMLCLARDPRALAKLLVATGLVGLLGVYVIWPRMDSFTGGGLSARFQDTKTTGRNDLGLVDLELFYAHPMLGVGPGRVAAEHRRNNLSIVSHTEFTRLLAEHGLLGLTAMVLMGVVGYRNTRRGATPREKAITLAMMAWGALFMLSSAMRLVAPCLTFGMGCAVLLPLEQPDAGAERARPARRTRRILAFAG